MGLDASVYCDCFEAGRLRRQPPLPLRLLVDVDGSLTWESHKLEEDLVMDNWRYDACEHASGVLLHHRLGNIMTIATIRGILEDEADRFPIILTRVVYDGSHGGDNIAVDLLGPLKIEVEWLRTVDGGDNDWLIDRFRLQMTELAAAAIRVKKPIAF